MTATSAELRVSDDPVREAADLLADAARRGGGIALSGGSTPGPAYELAATLEPDWGEVDLWFGDERAVPPDDPRSNYRLAETTLLPHLAAPPRSVHRVRGELGATEAARLYDAELRDATIALAVNGIGPDGHTASLFPDAPGLQEEVALALAAEPGFEPFVDRVTLTPVAFANVELLVYLVTGSAKAEPVRRAFAAAPSAATPASLVRGRRTLALLDRNAAAALS